MNSFGGREAKLAKLDTGAEAEKATAEQTITTGLTPKTPT